MVETQTLEGSQIIAIFLGLFGLAIFLLLRTTDFRWRSLWYEPVAVRRHWKIAVIYTVLTCALILGLTLWLTPGALWHLPLNQPDTWLMVIIFYPMVSVLPQGIVYRALFFARYASAFPSLNWAMAANAVFFGLGHLFYLNWVAVLLTILGGAIFAWAHARQGSFVLAHILHAIAGWALFTIGLGGAYFYHGNI